MGFNISFSLMRLKKNNKLIFFLWVFLASGTLIPVLILSGNMARLVLVSTVSVLAAYYVLHFEFNESLYKYPYKQQVLTLIGLILLLNP
ncbi:MAG TPA: hypothetical protein VJ179_00110 [Patescibacteria group bacterium]|nr:hypothetical protein [Patescibacteria group bacterium]